LLLINIFPIPVWVPTPVILPFIVTVAPLSAKDPFNIIEVASLLAEEAIEYV
jgi:hypothetical protein